MIWHRTQFPENFLMDSMDNHHVLENSIRTFNFQEFFNFLHDILFD